MRPPARFTLPVILALVLALGGCASSEPPTPPLSAETYMSPWLVVVVEPGTPVGWSQRRRSLGQATATLDELDQPYSLYTAPGREDPGISADSIYRDDTLEPVINTDVVQRIAAEHSATSVFVIEPEETLDLQQELNEVTLEPYDIQMDRGDGTALDVAVYLDRDAAGVTRTSLYHGENLELTWQAIRATKKNLYRRVPGPLDVVGFNARALTIEALTGRALIASDFVFKTDRSVLVYSYGRSTIYGSEAYVDGGTLVVSEKEGPVTVPLHLVSMVKEQTSREKLFPTAPTQD